MFYSRFLVGLNRHLHGEFWKRFGRGGRPRIEAKGWEPLLIAFVIARCAVSPCRSRRCPRHAPVIVDFASQIRQLGWLQGSFLPDALRSSLRPLGCDRQPIQEGDAFLCISDSCDLLHDELNEEPFGEFVLLRPGEANPGNGRTGAAPSVSNLGQRRREIGPAQFPTPPTSLASQGVAGRSGRICVGVSMKVNRRDTPLAWSKIHETGLSGRVRPPFGPCHPPMPSGNVPQPS